MKESDKDRHHDSRARYKNPRHPVRHRRAGRCVWHHHADDPVLYTDAYEDKAVYTDADKKRLALILRAKTIGTKLSDIKTFLELYGQEGEGRMRQLEFVIEMTAKEIERLEEKKAEIETTLNELRVIHEGSKTRLAQRKSNSRYAR
jgi:DNA-binding transcriptional MerR regulator